MKPPVVDYREFRLSRWNEPRFSHLKLLLGWVGYFALFFLTENLIPPERCRPIACAWDNRIPFCEYFIIPYVLWYVWIVASLLYFALYDIPSFRNLQKYIIITQIVAMAVYILFPNRQDLRPVVFPRDNFFTDVVALLYALDTNTGVCPSLHWAYSIGIASVWLKRKESRPGTKLFMVFAAVMVCLSTMFVKQHSLLDGIAALPVCILAEYVVFHGPWRERKQG